MPKEVKCSICKCNIENPDSDLYQGPIQKDGKFVYINAHIACRKMEWKRRMDRILEDGDEKVH